MVLPPPSYSLSSLFNVKGSVALVTGSGSGLGLYMAQALATNGAKVYITGRRKDVLDKAAANFQGENGSSLIPLQLDVTVKESISNAVKVVEANEGKLDVLINNAGTFGNPREVWRNAEAPERKVPFTLGTALYNVDSFEEWESVYGLNTISTYFVTLAFLELLQKGSKAKADYSSTVINISSCISYNKFSVGVFPYTMSKGATNHLTTMMAADFATRNIRVRVNCIAPGPFPSEITRPWYKGELMTSADADSATGSLLPIPAARGGKEEEIGGTCVYLVSPAGYYTNGQVISVDGGHSLVNPGMR